MTVENLAENGSAANCYLVCEGDTAVLIDASAKADDVCAALERRGARLAAVLLTHGHFDHLLYAAAIKEATGAPLLLGEGDADLPADPEKNASLPFGEGRAYPAADKLLREGDALSFGALSVSVWHTPGHTQGSLCYLIGDAAFTGDTLFKDGFGRTDLYGGDRRALWASLRRLRTLPPAARIYPGHGDSALLGDLFHTIYS